MYRLIQTIIISFCISAAYAQTPKCKPTHKSNKHKLLVYDDIEIIDVTWKYKDNEVMRAGDSITVKKGDVLIAQFKINDKTISGTTYIEYHPNGTIKRLDSLVQYGGSFKRYWGEFYADVIRTKQFYSDGNLQQVVYYRHSGRDSLTQKWYPSGQLFQSAWGDKKWGTDSSTHTWDEKGILTSIKTRKFLKEFYHTGIIKTLTVDTIISNRPVAYKEEYYPTGTLQSVTYYCEEKPCETWLYYTEKGNLSKTVKQTDVSSITYDGTMQYDVVSDISEDKITQAKYNGNTPLYKYINEKLAETVCRSALPLENEYLIKFTVNTEGQAIFENIAGKNHTTIQEMAQQAINEMPKWQPGTKGKQNITTRFTLKLYLKEY